VTLNTAKRQCCNDKDNEKRQVGESYFDRLKSTFEIVKVVGLMTSTNRISSPPTKD
jgi:hypothetical protein